MRVSRFIALSLALSACDQEIAVFGEVDALDAETLPGEVDTHEVDAPEVDTAPDIPPEVDIAPDIPPEVDTAPDIPPEVDTASDTGPDVPPDTAGPAPREGGPSD